MGFVDNNQNLVRPVVKAQGGFIDTDNRISTQTLTFASHQRFLCISVDSHFPVGQTLWRVTAQHPGLELQVFNVSVLPLLMQQPAQQHLNSEISQNNSICPWHTRSVQLPASLLVTAAGADDHQLTPLIKSDWRPKTRAFTCWQFLSLETETTTKPLMNFILMLQCVCVCTSGPVQCCWAWHISASPGPVHAGTAADSSGKESQPEVTTSTKDHLSSF